MGDGKILRDYLFVEDLVDALLDAAICESAYGEVFNVGMGKGVTFIELANAILDITGQGSIEFVPFNQERKVLEPGDYVGDYRKIRNIIGWEARVDLRLGLTITVDYYRRYRQHYWTTENEPN
jgi:nucleoside-diphosphate-sugar epimerase